MRFVDPGVGTVNEQYLLAALRHHGELLASGREICYRKNFGPSDERFIGDVFGLFLDRGTPSLVGIEVKDWAAPVTPKLAASYLATYGSSCDFVYLGARKFLPGVHRISRIGLLDLSGPRVVREARRLTPDTASWKFVVASLDHSSAVVARHPRQRTFLSHGGPQDTRDWA